MASSVFNIGEECNLKKKKKWYIYKAWSESSETVPVANEWSAVWSWASSNFCESVCWCAVNIRTCIALFCVSTCAFVTLLWASNLSQEQTSNSVSDSGNWQCRPLNCFTSKTFENVQEIQCFRIVWSLWPYVVLQRHLKHLVRLRCRWLAEAFRGFPLIDFQSLTLNQTLLFLLIIWLHQTCACIPKTTYQQGNVFKCRFQ